MRTLGRFCLLVVTCSVFELYQRFLRIFLGFLHMDFSSTLKFLTQVTEIGCGLFLLGCFSRIFNVLGVILILGFCMRVLHFRWHSEGLIRYLFQLGVKPRSRFYLRKTSVGDECDSNAVHFKHNNSPLKPSENSNSTKKNNLSVGKENDNSNGDSNSMDLSEEKCNKDREVHDADEVFDVVSLRKLVKTERKRANAAYAELEKERTASASAADEAMAMILRLQSEKSKVEIQANQYRRMVEQKQEYDQSVIESLSLIITEQESEMALLQDQLVLYREKLRQHMSEDKIDQMDRICESRDLPNISLENEMDSQTDFWI